MYGYQLTYNELLQKAGFESLKTRRDNALRKFADRTVGNPMYERWFRQNENERRNSQRNTKQYEEKLARTTRLYNSPLFTIRRHLNSNPNQESEQLEHLDPDLNDPFAD